MNEPPSPPRRSTATLVSALAFVGYLAISRVTVDLFPFSTLNMYSHSRTQGASRLFARDATGRVRELDRFDRWDCPTSLDPAAQACPNLGNVSTIDYVDRDMAVFLRAHRARAPESPPVDVVRRVWRLTDHAGPPPFEDCLLLRCRASWRP